MVHVECQQTSAASDFKRPIISHLRRMIVASAESSEEPERRIPRPLAAYNPEKSPVLSQPRPFKRNMKSTYLGNARSETASSETDLRMRFAGARLSVISITPCRRRSRDNRVSVDWEKEICHGRQGTWCGAVD